MDRRRDGHQAKFQLLVGAMDAQLWRLCVILVLTTVVSYYYYLRLAWYAWMREPATPTQHEQLHIPLPMRVALLVGAIVVIYLGLFPSSVLELARDSAAGLSAEQPTLLLGTSE